MTAAFNSTPNACAIYHNDVTTFLYPMDTYYIIYIYLIYTIIHTAYTIHVIRTPLYSGH